MVTPFDVFEKQFPKYSCSGVTCTDGKICLLKSNDKQELGKTADLTYFTLYDRLHVGMSIDEAYKIWCNILCSNPFYIRWAHYADWNPLPREWWTGLDEKKYHMVDGIVRKVGPNDRLERRHVDYAQRKALSELAEGMTLEQAREHMLSKGRGSSRCFKLYRFEPVVKQDSSKKYKPVRQYTHGGTPIENACPPLLSTTDVDVRVLHPDCDDRQMPDQVQVVLFALTKIWGNPQRTRINPIAKKNVKVYSDFAYKQMSANRYLRAHPEVYEHLKVKAMRVTKDCCIEVDFEVVGLSPDEFYKESKRPRGRPCGDEL